MQLASLLSFALYAAAAALPTAEHGLVALEKRASCVDYCGNTCYWQNDIDAAVNKGYSDYVNGVQEGSGKYPHQYYDNEGFTFAVDGPYYEFPILSSYKVYNGGSPGPDRVVFNDNGDLAGLITHTGASGNNFKQCRKA
ncbi:hypothetical protein PYCC9005_005860 [Savitreella phatthalungensis]